MLPEAIRLENAVYDGGKFALAENERMTCPYAESCGSCSFIRLEYGRSLQIKQKQLQQLLGGFGQVLPILGMEQPWHYRHKVHHVFASDRKGHVFAGTYRPGTHYVVNLEHCLIEDEQAQAIIETVRRLVVRLHIPVYDEDRECGALRHVMVRKGYATGEFLVILVTATRELPRGRELLSELLKQHPQITTVVQNLNPRHTTMVLGQKNLTLYGSGSIDDCLCGMRFRLSPGSFYQVNPAQTEKLYRTAVDFAGLTGRENVIDAYCGIGTIGLIASARAQEVLGVELNPDAVRDAQLNARRNGVSNARFLQGDAGDFMVEMAKAGETADVVLMDPPRSGSTPEFLKACCLLQEEKIVYVSCNPLTLKRDLLFLCGRGYRVQKIQPVDMFPFTEHVETVVLLSKNE